MRRIHIASLWLVAAVGAASAGAQTESKPAEGAPEPGPGANSKPRSSELLAKLDQLFDRRDDPSIAKELDQAIAEAIRAHGEEFDVLWRAARYKQWQADGAPDGDAKKQLGKEAWELGDRATRLEPERVEGYYFAAV